MNSPEQHRWEPKDADAKATYLVGIVLVVSVALFALISGGLFRVLSLRKDGNDPRPPAIASVREGAAEPLLQTNPPADLAAYNAAQQHALHSYGWVDRQRGVVHLPIERAMDLLLQRGLPVTPPEGSDVQYRQQQGGGKVP